MTSFSLLCMFSLQLVYSELSEKDCHFDLFSFDPVKFAKEIDHDLHKLCVLDFHWALPDLRYCKSSIFVCSFILYISCMSSSYETECTWKNVSSERKMLSCCQKKKIVCILLVMNSFTSWTERSIKCIHCSARVFDRCFTALSITRNVTGLKNILQREQS